MAGTTRQRRHARTRGQILDAAQALIEEKGYEKLSLRAVARAVDYSPAGLYEYFDNKDSLLYALAERAGLRLKKHLVQALEQPDDHPLVCVGLAYIQFALSEKEDFLLLFSRLLSQRKQHEDTISETSAYGVLRQCVEESVADGSIGLPPGMAADDIAYGVWSQCHGAAMLQLTHLADYQANFPKADRLSLQALVKGLRA